MNDLTIPQELATFSLDLEEIGAIIILLLTPHLDLSTVDKWGNNERFVDVIKKLIERGIVIPADDDGEGNLNVEINLE